MTEPMSNEQRLREALEKIVVRCCQGMVSPIMRDVISIAQGALASTEPEQPAKLYDCAACGIVRGCDDEECCLECGHSVFPATVVEPVDEGEDCEFCNGDGIIRGKAPGGKVVEVAYCPNQCKSSTTEPWRTYKKALETIRERAMEIDPPSIPMAALYSIANLALAQPQAEDEDSG